MTAKSDINERVDIAGGESTDAQRRVIRELLGLTDDLPKSEMLERLAKAGCSGMNIGPENDKAIESESDAIDRIQDEECKRLIDGKNHEVITVLENAGFEMPVGLKEMLNEDSGHQGGRKGCGFTQATRFLAESIREKSDRIKSAYYSSKREVLEAIDMRDIGDMKDMKPESKLILRMLADIYDARPKRSHVPELPSLGERPEIGTCTTAEIYFFEYLYDTGWPIVGDKKMNFILDEKGEAIFIEKVGLGDNHSALSLKHFYTNGVLIPPGSLVALKYSDDAIGDPTISYKGNIIQSSDLEGVDFLRFTPLVAKPEDRARAFWSHVYFQIQNQMPGALQTTIQDFIDKAKSEVDSDMSFEDRGKLRRGLRERLNTPIKQNVPLNELQEDAKRYLELRKKYLIERKRKDAEQALKDAEQEKAFDRAQKIYAKLKGDPIFEQIRKEAALAHIKDYAAKHPDDVVLKEYTLEMTPDGWLIDKNGKPSVPVTGCDCGPNSFLVVLARAVKEFERRYPDQIKKIKSDA